MANCSVMNQFELEWNHYLKKNYPGGIPPYQEKELRLAFYAGGLACWQNIERIAEETKSVPEEQEAMDELENELREFQVEQKRKAREGN